MYRVHCHGGSGYWYRNIWVNYSYFPWAPTDNVIVASVALYHTGVQRIVQSNWKELFPQMFKIYPKQTFEWEKTADGISMDLSTGIMTYDSENLHAYEINSGTGTKRAHKDHVILKIKNADDPLKSVLLTFECRICSIRPLIELT